MERDKKSNKIRDIVRVHQALKNWRSKASKPNNNGGKTINKFLKKTLSFSENSSVSSSLSNVPKGYLAVNVGKQYDQKKRFVIPTHYLGHQAFGFLLREAEDEFGFEQQGILQIPCDVGLFESVVSLLESNHRNNKVEEELFFFQVSNNSLVCDSSHIQLCT